MAYIVSKCFKFSDVVGIPTGGIRFANALRKYCSNRKSDPTLIVDDVLTTGGSMESMRKEINTHCIGVVIFDRTGYSRKTNWIYSIWEYGPIFTVINPLEVLK